MTTLFSYVVQHDYGIEPNPFGGFCTLVNCKYSKSRRSNIVERSERGDWIVGTGGANSKLSAGHGKLIYAMRVDDKLSLVEFYQDERFHGRKNTLNREDGFALISQYYFYFGRAAIGLERIPKQHLDHPLEKKGPGYRKDFSQEFINDFVQWLESKYSVGKHGSPCAILTQDSLLQIDLSQLS